MSKSELSLIETIVQQHLSDYFSSQNAPRFVVGVSGGMDSMALVYAFSQLNISVYVVHVNYQKRGAAADKDAGLVAHVCEQWGLDYTIFSVDPEEAEGQNFQQWARNRRYQLFEETAQSHSADAIAVGHHRDDQIETIVQKILRGAGLASWSGMQVWNGQLFRPLLNISRNEISAYVEQNDIPYRTDASNLQSDFARNFLRNEWLDGLSEFFPGWKQNVLRIPQQASCFEQSLEWIANRITDSKGLDREQFQTLSISLQKAIVLHLLKQRRPDIEVSKHALKQLKKLHKLQTGKSIQLTKNFSLLRDRKHYCIIKEELDLFTPVKLNKADLLHSGYTKDILRFSVVSCDSPDVEHSLYLDIGKLSWPLTLRRWQEGDRFQPLGMEGHQLVSDHLTNRKISAAHKDKALVVESFDETICAVIFPPIKKRTALGTISEQVKWDANTQQCMQITYSKIG